jgi:hypothetical protein
MATTLLAFCLSGPLGAQEQDRPIDAGAGWASDQYLNFNAIRFMPAVEAGAERPSLTYIFSDEADSPSGLALNFPLWMKSKELAMEINYVGGNQASRSVTTPKGAIQKFILEEGQPHHPDSVFIAVGGFANAMVDNLCHASQHIAAVILVDPEIPLSVSDATPCPTAADMPIYTFTTGAQDPSAFVQPMRNKGHDVFAIEIPDMPSLAPSFGARFFEATGLRFEDTIQQVIERATE